MEKKYSDENPLKNFKKKIKHKNDSMNPSEKSIQFILNYSKSLSVETSKNIGSFFLVLN